MLLLVIKKNRPAWQGAVLGGLFGVLGILGVALLLRKLLSKNEVVEIEETMDRSHGVSSDPWPRDATGSISDIAPDVTRRRSSRPVPGAVPDGTNG